MRIINTEGESIPPSDSVAAPSHAPSTEAIRLSEPATAQHPQTPTCQIQWVDAKGQPTPDSNLAVGRVRRERYFHTLHGRTLEVPQTEWFYICAHHLHQLERPGMEHWTFEPLSPDAAPAEPLRVP